MVAINAYIQVLRKYAVFDGRANRPEYWWFMLVHIIVIFASIAIPLAIIGDEDVAVVVFLLYYVATLVPCWAVTVRRLHDSGKSAWVLLVRLIPIPFLGALIMLGFMLVPSDSGKYNDYGPRPSPEFKELS